MPHLISHSFELSEAEIVGSLKRSVLRGMELGHTPPLLVFGYLSAMRALGKMLFFLSSASSDIKSKLVQQDQFGLSTHLFWVRL